MRWRWVKFLAIAFAVLLVVLATIPWWLPAVLAISPRYGVTYGTYARIGYQRFALYDVAVRRPGVTVKVDRVEADSPIFWVWRHYRKLSSPVMVGHWSVDVEKQPPTTPSSPSGWVPLRAKLEQIAQTLDQWLPTAETGAGIVRWPGGEIAASAATWRNGSLSVRQLRYRSVAADARATFGANDVVTVTASDPEDGAEVVLENKGVSVNGEVSWWNQKAALAATFGPTGWLPSNADVHADNLKLPGDRLKLGGAYAFVTGHAHVVWADRKFSADVALNSEPRDETKVPPLRIAFRTDGDAEAITVAELHAAVPGGTADLTAPVTVDRMGRLRESAAVFRVRYDLSQQPWLHGKGVVVGEAKVVPQSGAAPAVDFDVRANDVAIPGAAAERASATGRLGWPLLQVTQFALVGPTGEELHGRGAWNFREKQLSDAAVEGAVARSSIARWVPWAEFGAVAVDVHAEGPLTDLRHGGRLQVANLIVGSLKPASAKVEWHGHGMDVTEFTANATIGDAAVAVAGEVNRRAANLSNLTLTESGSEALHLAKPVRISWAPGFIIDGLHLVGKTAAVDVNLTWGPEGHVDTALHGIPSEWVSSIMSLPGPAWTIPSLAVVGDWKQGPMNYSAAGSVDFQLPQQRRAAISLSAKGTADGLTINALHAVESGNAVVNASGTLPITITPGRRPLVGITATGPLVLEATTVPNAAFWQQLANMTGLELRSPQVTAHLTGTWEQPRGVMTFRVDHAAMDPKRFSRPMPTVDDVDVAIAGDADGFRLNRFSLAVAGQIVRASGRLPLGRNALAELMRAPAKYVQERSELQVEVPDAQVAMFSRFLPAALAPAGRLQADVRFTRGTLGGYLRLRDAASKPLGPLGVLQQVSADVEFTDHRVVLRQVTAMAGGQLVKLAGSVELPTAGWFAEPMSEPKYDISLQGQNLPFVRQSGLLVRGDLDLKLVTPDRGPPGISGKVVLRDSLFLTDVRSFLPHGSGASPSRRPPYFAVDTPPLNTWTLDVEVTGTRFMRVRTPVFIGLASTRFHLGGTLGVPRAIGDATIDQGSIRMPFASFDVKQGSVRLTEESPYEPTIYLRGAGRHYGYDLTMEIAGKASAPDITFTSSPALDAEQVLLMVMTGAAPSNEVTTSLTHRAVQIGAFFGQSLIGSLTGANSQPDRLTIESGEKISQQGKETYSIEYKLNDRWSVTGEYDEFDEYNAGFKWRLAPKKLDR